MDWDQNKLEELAQVLSKYELTELEVTSGDTHIVLKKTPAAVQMVSSYPMNVPMGMMGTPRMNPDFRRITEQKAIADELETSKESDNNKEKVSPVVSVNQKSNDGFVTSPIAGIFYRQSQPGNPPYVEIGEHVKKGQTICLVEAMKMINEITANRDGVVKEFLVENEQFVEYGAPLVMIEEG